MGSTLNIQTTNPGGLMFGFSDAISGLAGIALASVLFTALVLVYRHPCHRVVNPKVRAVFMLIGSMLPFGVLLMTYSMVTSSSVQVLPRVITFVGMAIYIASFTVISSYKNYAKSTKVTGLSDSHPVEAYMVSFVSHVGFWTVIPVAAIITSLMMEFMLHGDWVSAPAVYVALMLSVMVGFGATVLAYRRRKHLSVAV